MKRVSLAVMLLAAIALVVNTVFVDSRTRPAMARDGGQLIETPVVTANVKVEGNGPAIVFIHGFGAAIDWWDEIAPTLAKDHRAIRVDLIGHGGTAAPASGYTIEQQAALVSAILDKLGVERVTVIAHSMGGEVATALSEINPKRIERLIYIDSPPTAGTTFTIMTEAYLMPVLGELLRNSKPTGRFGPDSSRASHPVSRCRRYSSPTSSNTPTPLSAPRMKAASLTARRSRPMRGSPRSSRCRHCLRSSARATRSCRPGTRNISRRCRARRLR